MSIAIIENSILKGEVRIPPSKSAAHRALICSFLSCGGSVEGIIDSSDMKATEGALEALKNGDKTINCLESGSTLRFIIPVAAALGKSVSFSGCGRLPERPIGEYIALLEEHGVCCKSNKGFLPLEISGKLKSGIFRIRGDVSSQYITGLLLALPLLDGKSEIVLTSPLQSKPYVDINMAFKALDTIIYRFEILNISSDESELEEAIAQIDGAELEEKGLRYGNYITPANVRCVGVCRKCGKSFVFNTYNYPMGELEPAYSDDGLHTAKLHTAPVDKKNWRITLNGITYRYFNSFCCPHCGGAYIDYKNRNELKRAGNLGCVHFGYKEADITALSELYNEYEY